MPTSRHTTQVEFDEELWELVQAEAANAGVSVSHFVHDAVIARIVVGPADPRVFELLTEAVRQAMQDEPHPETRRQAERSLGVLARLSATRRRDDARALRAESAQVIRMSQRRQEQAAVSAGQPDPQGAARSAFRINADWTDVRVAGTRNHTPGDAAPDLACLQEEHIHPDDRRRVRTAIAQAIQTRGIFEVQYRVRQADSVRLIYLRALPLLTAVGTITEWVAVVTDVSGATGATGGA